MNTIGNGDKWQMDHTRLDLGIFVTKKGEKGEKRPCFPWLCIIMDSYTRRIVGFKLSPKPLTDAQDQEE
jgi:transposase InsO family protein